LMGVVPCQRSNCLPPEAESVGCCEEAPAPAGEVWGCVGGHHVRMRPESPEERDEASASGPCGKQGCKEDGIDRDGRFAVADHPGKNGLFGETEVVEQVHGECVENRVPTGGGRVEKGEPRRELKTVAKSGLSGGGEGFWCDGGEAVEVKKLGQRSGPIAVHGVDGGQDELVSGMGAAGRGTEFWPWPGVGKDLCGERRWNHPPETVVELHRMALRRGEPEVVCLSFVVVVGLGPGGASAPEPRAFQGRESLVP